MAFSIPRSYIRQCSVRACEGYRTVQWRLCLGLVLMVLLPTGAHAILDARTGFHDIKAIPEFQPLRWLWLAGLALLLLFICLSIYLRRRQHITELIPQVEPMLPYDEARQSLTSLRVSIANQRIAVRDIGASVSQLVRRYIDRRLFKQGVVVRSEEASGLDLTLWEIAKLLDAKCVALRKREREEASAIIRAMAADVDYLEFAETSEQLYAAGSAEIENLLVTTERLLETIHRSELYDQDTVVVTSESEMNTPLQTRDLTTEKVQKMA